MSNKASGGSRYILVVLRNGEVYGSTASESNSKAEFRRLKKMAKELVQSESWDYTTHAVRLFYIVEPEQLMGPASMLNDLEVQKWLEERKRKEQKKQEKSIEG